MKVDVIIPVYGPGNRLLELFDRLGHQTVPVDRLIVMNTEKSLWDKWTETLEPGKLPENLSVYHVTKEEFDHGATRNAGIEHSDADVCVCMTHDALPADTGLLKALTDALFAEKDIAVALTVSLLTYMVLLCVFKRTKYLQFVIAAFVLSIFFLLYVLLPQKPWQLFLIAIPALIIVFLSCNIRIKPGTLPRLHRKKE